MDYQNNYIYIYHLGEFCILPMFPDSITDSMAVDFSNTTALARSAPVWSYNHSGPRTVNFTLELHRDIMNDLNIGVSNMKPNVVDFNDPDYVDLLLNRLQACALPKYYSYTKGSKVVEPPQVAVRLSNEIFIRGIINGNIQVTYGKPILDNGKYAKATITLAITEVDPYDAPTVSMVGGFRGVTSMFKNGIYKDDSDSLSYYNQEFIDNSLNTSGTTEVDPRYDLDVKKTYDRPLQELSLPFGKSLTKKITQKVVPDNNPLTIIDFSDSLLTLAQGDRQNSVYSPYGSDTSKTTPNNAWHGYELAKRGNYH